MGNCIEKCVYDQKEERNEQQESVLEKPSFLVPELNAASEKEKDQTKGAMRIKIVLTKEELQLLLLQLKNKEGKRLEDVLDEIERSRSRRPVGPWKPSLDSIVESPEVPDQMNR